MIKILGIDGAARPTSLTRSLLQVVGSAIAANNAEFMFYSQAEHKLPVYDESQQSISSAAVQQLFSLGRTADAFVLCSPEYHGSMSGALKNVLDWLTYADGKVQTAGKIFGLIGGGGTLANSGAVLQMMMAVRAMHGWLLPNVIVSVPNIWNEFDSEGQLVPNSGQLDRINKFAREIVYYGQSMRELAENRPI